MKQTLAFIAAIVAGALVAAGWGSASELGAAAPPMATASTSQALQISVDTVVASGFDLPLQVTHAGDGSGRLYVVEQAGTIDIIENGTVLATPFLDLTSAVTTTGGEQGLLGLAFHPDYANNGYAYVDYTRFSDGATVVERYARSAGDPNQLDPATATTILTVDQPFRNHNGGQIVFGPDGYLYISLGDGGGTAQNNAQDTAVLLGSILRIDVDGGSPYTSPADNPYVGSSGRDEIWAIGLRNPWRFSFDRATGDVYIGDVGEADWEEIDFYESWGPGGSPGAVNYGWPCREGMHDFSPIPPCQGATLTDPIAEYGRSLGRSVTGGFVYRGATYPSLQGRYFYGDFISGRIWSLSMTATGFTTPTVLLDTDLSISAFGEDEAGELYVVDHGGGSVRRLTVPFPFVVRLPLILKP